MRTDGIRTLADVMDRCVIDPDTACWHWKAAKTAQGIPSMWYAPLGIRAGPGTILFHIQHGTRTPEGLYFHRAAQCKHRDCVNPAHRRLGDRRSQMLAAGIERNAIERVRISIGRRRRSKLTDAACADIRESSEPLHIVAARHGCCISHASRIRRGELRKPVNGLAVCIANLGG